MKTIEKCKKLISLTLMLLFVLSFICTGGVFSARADEANYTDVLSDLQKDKSFSVASYPADKTNTVYKIIQIAESKEGELLLYVYNPAYEVLSEEVTTVRFSTAINENFSPIDKSVTCLSTNKQFSKYVVKDFTVKDDALRYYSIVCLHRNWNETVDKESGTDDVIEEIAIPVEELFTASTVNGVVSYTRTYKETITITDRWDGFVEYPNGFKFYYNRCRSHYIAFNTDKRIDKLIEADVSYYYQECLDTITSTMFGTTTDTTKEDAVYVEKQTLTSIDKGQNQANGWFATTYTWDRIEKASDFLADADIKFSEEAKKNVGTKSWVLRYYESEISASGHIGEGLSTNYIYYTDVSKVTVLRLHFETDGVLYNLGVVDNKVNPSDKPNTPADGEGKEPSIWGWIVLILSIIIAVPILLCALKLLVQIHSGNSHYIVKIIFTIIIVGTLTAIAIIVVPWLSNLINELGGLGLKVFSFLGG